MAGGGAWRASDGVPDVDQFGCHTVQAFGKHGKEILHPDSDVAD
jgi:hypothetical protein